MKVRARKLKAVEKRPRARSFAPEGPQKPGALTLARPIPIGWKRMGHIYVDVTVRSLGSRRKPKTFRCLVDTGATDTLIPTDEARRLGLVPHRERHYQLGDGTVVTMKVAHAILEFEGEEVASDVTLGPPGVDPVLGVTALESTGFVVDPRTERLRKVAAIPLKSVRAAMNRGSTIGG